MKFTLKRKPQQKENEIRVIEKFAWIPIRIENIIYWFQFVKIKQIYIQEYEKIILSSKNSSTEYKYKQYWKNLKFINDGEV